MLRRTFPFGLLAAAGNNASTPTGTHMNSQQQVLEINSAYCLLRMCYRSIDIKIRSRHARNFLKKRLITQWAEKSKETDPQKQRLYMDLAGSFLQALHTDRNPKPNTPVSFQLSRRIAYDEQMKERAEKAASGVRRTRRMPANTKTN